MALAQTVLATVDVAVTAAIFYALLPAAEGLTFLRFVGIYLAAYAAGIAGARAGRHRRLRRRHPARAAALHAGGGGGRRAAGVPALLLHRAAVHRRLPVRRLRDRPAPRRAGALHRRAARGTDALEVPAIASLVALVGALLLFLGALPVRDTIVDAWAGRAAALASHFAASVVGSLLLVMALRPAAAADHRLGGSLLLLLNGAGIAWVRGESWWLWGAFGAAGRGAAGRPARAPSTATRG